MQVMNGFMNFMQIIKLLVKTRVNYPYFRSMIGLTP